MDIIRPHLAAINVQDTFRSISTILLNFRDVAFFTGIKGLLAKTLFLVFFGLFLPTFKNVGGRWMAASPFAL